VLLGSLVITLVAAVIWAGRPGPGNGRSVELVWPPEVTAHSASDLLAREGLLHSPRVFAIYLRVVRPSLDLTPGPHLLNDALSPRELVQRLARLPSRPVVKLTIPEGYNHWQIADRLHELQVCSRGSFRQIAADRGLLTELGIRGATAEGYLFPATYELPVDAAPATVLRTFVREMRRRLDRVVTEHRAAADRLRSELGWGEHEILTLASLIEKEAAARAEQKTIASVFFNRLRDPGFRPKATLQSDPTAAYGCLVDPDQAPSCLGFSGRVTPAMLRDALNRYNTYRHAGLPPGPIANAGLTAIEAVLAPAETNYLFFFATGDRRHTFSRTFEEHRSVVRGKASKVAPDEGLSPVAPVAP
jgi:UPF0755 protein